MSNKFKTQNLREIPDDCGFLPGGQDSGKPDFSDHHRKGDAFQSRAKNHCEKAGLRSQRGFPGKLRWSDELFSR
jgi:hypothetical protein